MNTLEGNPSAASVAQLMYRVLETDQGAVDLYTRALRAARREELRARWTQGGPRARANAAVATHVLARLQADATQETFGRQLVRNVTNVLAQNLEAAITFASPEVAEIVAAGAILQIETAVQLNWSLVDTLANRARGELSWLLRDALHRVAVPDRRSLVYSMSWLQELTIADAGYEADLPPSHAVDPDDGPFVTRLPTPVRVSFSPSSR